MNNFIRALKSKVDNEKRPLGCSLIQLMAVQVFEYTDCYGQKWMAGFFHWSFRVKK